VDILKDPKKQDLRLRYFVIVLTIILFFLLARSLFANGTSVYRENLIFGTTQRGTFSIDVFANGKIKPKSSNIIVSPESGIIAEVRSFSGASVKKGDTLLIIKNKKLNEKLVDSKLKLKKFLSTSKVTELGLDKLEANYKSQVNIAKYKVERAKYELTAKQKLVDMGNSAISLLDLKKTELTYKIANSEFESALKVLSAFKKKKKARLNELTLDLKGQKLELSRLKARVQSLNVKNRVNGIIQNLNFNVGERISAEQLIGKLVSNDNIHTVLKVSALDTHLISLGQHTKIEIGDKEYQGSVSRISPIVKGSTIDVTIEFKTMPTDLKINTFVNAYISVLTKQNVLTIPRPYNLIENTTNSLFVLNEAQQKLILRKIQLGYASKSRVEVIGGLKIGEQVVMSDTNSKLFAKTEIKVKS